MKSEILLSIIIPVYNTEKYLKRCIESIGVSNSEIEVILVNDGSIDKSLDICKSYEKYENIRIISGSNEGVSSSRNKGIKIAKGEYITFIDSDDYVSNNYIDEILKVINKDNFDIVVFGYDINYNDIKKIEKKTFGKSNHSILNADYIDSLYKYNLFNFPWNKIYKKSIIISNNLEFERNSVPCEDFIFNCDYYKYVENSVFIDKSLYNYMKQGIETTLVTKYYPNLFSTVKNAITKYNQLLDNFEDTRKEQKKYVTYKYLFTCIPNVFKGAKNPYDDYNKILNEMKKNNVFTICNPNDINFKILKLINKLPNKISYMIYLIIIKIYWITKGKKIK